MDNNNLSVEPNPSDVAALNDASITPQVNPTKSTLPPIPVSEETKTMLSQYPEAKQSVNSQPTINSINSLNTISDVSQPETLTEEPLSKIDETPIHVTPPQSNSVQKNDNSVLTTLLVLFMLLVSGLSIFLYVSYANISAKENQSTPTVSYP